MQNYFGNKFDIYGVLFKLLYMYVYSESTLESLKLYVWPV